MKNNAFYDELKLYIKLKIVFSFLFIFIIFLVPNLSSIFSSNLLFQEKKDCLQLTILFTDWCSNRICFIHGIIHGLVFCAFSVSFDFHSGAKGEVTWFKFKLKYDFHIEYQMRMNNFQHEIDVWCVGACLLTMWMSFDVRKIVRTRAPRTYYVPNETSKSFNISHRYF